LAPTPSSNRQLADNPAWGKYQLSLIEELLEYSKIEQQPLIIQPVTTDLPRDSQVGGERHE